jgi:hypothetical protein
VKKPMIPKLMTVGLLLLASTATHGSQVRHLTFGSGSGSAAGTNHQIQLTAGEAVAGQAKHVAGNFMGGLGFWEVLRQTHIAAPVGDELPPAVNRLSHNYPNPFNPSTRINFSLEAEAEVRLEVYDVRGRKVDTLLQEVRPAGYHHVIYEPKTLPSGVYLVLLRAGSFRATQRMMLVK